MTRFQRQYARAAATLINHHILPRSFVIWFSFILFRENGKAVAEDILTKQIQRVTAGFEAWKHDRVNSLREIEESVEKQCEEAFRSGDPYAATYGKLADIIGVIRASLEKGELNIFAAHSLKEVERELGSARMPATMPERVVRLRQALFWYLLAMGMACVAIGTFTVIATANSGASGVDPFALVALLVFAYGLGAVCFFIAWTIRRRFLKKI